jgi:hypothetical protein
MKYLGEISSTPVHDIPTSPILLLASNHQQTIAAFLHFLCKLCAQSAFAGCQVFALSFDPRREPKPSTRFSATSSQDSLVRIDP